MHLSRALRTPDFPHLQIPLPILVLLHHLQPLQSLQHTPRDTLGAPAEVAGHDAVPLSPTIDLGHGADPSATPQVQVPCCGGWGERGT